MQKKGLKPVSIVLSVVIVLALIIVGFVIFSHKTNATNTTGNVIAPTNSGTNNYSGMMNYTGTLLSASPYANYAYLISTSPLSSDAQTALAGFQLNSTANQDGTTTYTLTALKSGYVSQLYTLQPGQNLYFIERSMGDDNVADNDDYNLGDDFAIVVNSNGYIVQNPSRFMMG